MVPSGFLFVLYIHLHPMGFFPVGRLVMFQVLLLLSASSSLFIAQIHSVCFDVSLKLDGSDVLVSFGRNCLCFSEKFVYDT